ncbi:hypothetical protein THER_1658 [Thermodesulfovibrio sp. N1]|nr:hypothetical protein THER_1658 [Thermodesulfovibrio sp. N1]
MTSIDCLSVVERIRIEHRFSVANFSASKQREVVFPICLAASQIFSLDLSFIQRSWYG